MFPTSLFINLATLVLNLFQRFLDEQTLRRILHINANIVLRVIGDGRVILFKIIAEERKLKPTTPLKRSVALTPATAELACQRHHVTPETGVLRVSNFAAKPLLGRGQIFFGYSRQAQN